MIIDFEYCGPNYIIYDLANLVQELQSEYEPEFSLKTLETDNEIDDPELKEFKDNILGPIERFRLAFPSFIQNYTQKEFSELVLGFRAYNFFFWICLTIKSEIINFGLGLNLSKCAKLRMEEFTKSFEILKWFFIKKGFSF